MIEHNTDWGKDIDVILCNIEETCVLELPVVIEDEDERIAKV